MYPSGSESGEAISVTQVYDDLTQTMNSLTEVEKHVTNIQEDYLDPVISIQSDGYYMVTANEIHADQMISTPILRILNPDDNVGYMSFSYKTSDQIAVSYVNSMGAS